MDSRCESDAARRARTQLATLMRAAIGNGEVLDARVLAGLRDYQRPGEPDFLTHLISVFFGSRASGMLKPGATTGHSALPPTRSREQVASWARSVYTRCAHSSRRRLAAVFSRVPSRWYVRSNTKPSASAGRWKS